MKNTLSPVLLALQEALETQGDNVSRWTPETIMVNGEDEKGGNILWIKASEIDNILDDDQVAILTDADLLENDGEALKVKAGRGSELAIGVRIGELQKKVRSTERDASTVQVMGRKVKDLERQLKVARDSSAADLAMAQLIQTMSDSFKIKPNGPQMKFDRTKSSKKEALAGIPTLMLSDWHWGEVVDPDQIEGLNEFNLEIANRRADRTFLTSLELLHQRQAGQTYDGMAVLLGGDMFSGNIHEELRITNDAPIHDCLLSLAEKLTGGICELAKNFPWIYVGGVVGNHGRIDRKPTAKFAVKDNYDWLLYNMVAMLVRGRLGDKCNVQFDISDALDLPFNLYNTKYLLTHGDQIGGGGGLGGFWPAMMKVAHRKQQRAVKSGGAGFDYMVCGHFHKYGNVANCIVNGSLKGYDEWVYKMNFEWERAQQALWVTHPEYGITGHLPVYADPLLADTTRQVHALTPAAGLRKVNR